MIVFDIETGPLPIEDIREICGPFDPDSVKLGNTKDEAKIGAKIEEARQSYEADLLDKAALSALTGRVLAIGYLSTDTGKTVISASDETRILQEFWQKFEQVRQSRRKLVGHNIAGFDLPFLIQRSWLLGVPVSASVFDRNRRYLDPTFVDTMTYWQAGNWRACFTKLDTLAKAFGIPGKPDGINGGDFARLWFGTAEERVQAIEYLKNDLAMTAKVAESMGIV